MKTLAIVPVKELEIGKSRLAAYLTHRDRHRLIQLMLEDVLAALRASRGIDEIWIVSADKRFAQLQCVLIDDDGGGLNCALAAAAARAAAVASTVIMVAADLPFVGASDIEALIRAANSHAVVIVPDRHGTGTNALVLSPPSLLTPRFGINSRRLHEESANTLGIDAYALRLWNVARDIDTLEDAIVLATASPSRYGFLTANDFAKPASSRRET